MRKPKGKDVLPSGSIRKRVYTHTDSAGKKHYKSFTGSSAAEVDFRVAEWRLSRQDDKTTDMTVCEAVGRYIALKESVLSPSTVREYRAILRREFETTRIGATALKALDAAVVQRWVSDLSAENSPKTVRNIWGLFRSAVTMFEPSLRLSATLPQKRPAELYCPSDDDVRTLLLQIQGAELEKAVLLAAFGPLRRGEICALVYGDINGDVISVTKSKVVNERNDWEIKPPKTVGSNRQIIMPGFVIEKLGTGAPDAPVVNLTPHAVTVAFERAVRKAGLPPFRFHDLRHYSASIMHAIGVPDQYIMQRGGWSSDNVMKRVYRNSINTETLRQTERIVTHFGAVYDTKYDTEAENPHKY